MTVVAVVGSLALAAGAQAEITSIPADAEGGGNIACATVASGANAGERHCSGIFTSFEEAPLGNGAPIDINVGFPPAPASGPDGDFPIVGVFHGWGGSKESLTGSGLQQWLDAGYAVFSMSDRGWGLSCGGADPKRLTDARCAHGYNHLLDTRYEVRDAQEVFEALADRDASGGPAGTGLIDPQAIAATGGSYGGGMSMALGALRDRKMVGGEALAPDDGTLVPWVSDEGTPMEIAAVQPDIPWTDLAYSLAPNGATLDYVADAPYYGPNGDRRIGVLKQSFVAGLYATGQALSNYSPADPDAALPEWYARVNEGEPYDGDPVVEDLIEELTTHHSSYYIPEHTDGPAPILISNGWTDDLFPPDEAIRFYNRTRTNSPATPVSLIFTDHGHQRGQNKAPDAAFRNDERHRWFDFYVKGEGEEPHQGVQTLTQVCGGPSGGETGPFDDAGDDPYEAPSWAEIAPGEIRHADADTQPILPHGGDPTASRAFDPIAGGGACATASGADQPGAANYRLDPAPAGGFTLMGSPTILASFYSPSPTAQVAARLVDVAPGGSQTLVARGLWRPATSDPSEPEGTRQVFQLHPNGWHFAEGHVAKLELLPADQPYGRNSNGQGPLTVSQLELRLPVIESPGALDGRVAEPAGKVLPPGYELAAGYQPATDDDADDDGFPDDSDNCPDDANADQADEDGDGIGDACDTAVDDRDDDGVADGDDNCPDDANPTQEDADGDGTGDACDPDADGDRDDDGDLDGADNCPDDANADQADADGDGIGDACDVFDNGDIDGDDVANDDDNCPSNSNEAQGNADDDGLGDACDGDLDGDQAPNVDDNCPADANQSQTDGDGDGRGDACDSDDDNDGVADAADACRAQAGTGADGCPPAPLVPSPSAGICDGALERAGAGGDDDLDGGEGRDALLGRDGDDRLRGRGEADCIWGNRGADRIAGNDGDDKLAGGLQADEITGGPGFDRIKGGGGRDVIDVRDGERDEVSCGRGSDAVRADPDDDLASCESQAGPGPGQRR